MKREFKVMKNILKLLVLLPLLTGCADFFTPAVENIRNQDAMYTETQFAQGLLLSAYNQMPYNNFSTTDVATDDAISNDMSNTFFRASTETWTAFSSPFSYWQNGRASIQYVNLFLQCVDSTKWADIPTIRKMFIDRLKGEAYAIRALQMYSLLRAHGGWSSSGKLLGVPILTKPEDYTSNFNYPRNTFQECLDAMYTDMNAALQLLPLDYGDLTSNAGIPAKYVAIGITNYSDYNRVFGNIVRGRLTGRILEAIRSQASLLAASPAFKDGNNVTWAKAADDAAVVLDRIGVTTGIQATGYTWYGNGTEVNGLGSGVNSAEVIWRATMPNADTNPESDLYPPSLFGRGRINPSQNLVDAFPAANGYPISNPLSNYNPQNPYASRDPRLAKYIVINGATQASTNGVVTTGTFGTNNDAINRQTGSSTRTGYYLRKTTRADVNLNPSSITNQKHVYSRIRYTEIFLNYAEAANEAWGPTGTGTHTYSAYDIIKAIRKRVLALSTDPYLESIKTDQSKMRDLIRNERRLELCFENIRFWDLRRWKVDISVLNQKIRGMQIDKNTDGTLLYTPIDVENRSYKNYMYYGPIPLSEILKFSLLEQNAGWQ
jgi:hypothetical protein